MSTRTVFSTVTVGTLRFLTHLRIVGMLTPKIFAASEMLLCAGGRAAFIPSTSALRSFTTRSIAAILAGISASAAKIAARFVVSIMATAHSPDGAGSSRGKGVTSALSFSIGLVIVVSPPTTNAALESAAVATSTTCGFRPACLTTETSPDFSNAASPRDAANREIPTLAIPVMEIDTSLDLASSTSCQI
jgi:hypothetical protein